jgi:hypothetical protein
MREGTQEKLENALLKVLNPDEKRLLSLISIENRKDKLVFRMPKDVISLDAVWLKIKEECGKLGIGYLQADTYATLDELDDVLEDVKWLWKDWLPRGFVTMMVGDPGIGKSMVVLDIIKFITSGKNYPDCENKEKPTPVIWIDTEASQQLLRMRAKKMGLDRTKVYIPVIGGDILGQVDVMNDEHRSIILDMIENVEPSLIVLDSLGGSHTRGENKFEEIAPIMKFFALIARDRNIAVLMTHHLNKGGPGESPEVSLYRIRGSTAIPQFARSIMALEKLDDDKVRLRMIKSNLARLVKPFSIIPTLDSDGDITAIDYKTYEPPPKKQTKMISCADWIVAKLKEFPDGIRVKELIDIAEPFGYTKGNLYTSRSYLADRITVKGTGREAYWSTTNNNDHDSINQIIKAKKEK